MPAVKKPAPKRKASVGSPAIVSDPFTAAAASAKKSKSQTKTEAKENTNVEDPIVIADEEAAKAEVSEDAKEAVVAKKIELDDNEPVEEKEEEKEKPKKGAAKKPAAKKGKGAAAAKKKNDDDDEGEKVEEEAEEPNNSTAAVVKYNKEEFKLTSNGKPFNLKIVSWNINGIRAWIEKGGMEYLRAEEPDIFCCQETKCDKSKIPLKAELPKYTSYWLSGDTQGYSGVGILTKIKPIKVTYGINNKKFDNEGRVICAEFDKFFLINTYIPNSSRGLVRLPFRLEWEAAFRKWLAELETQKPVVWCGDLNVAHHPIDIRNPDTNLKSAGFTVEERECFTNVLADGYFDSFRFLYPERVAYTYWSYMRNSRAANVGWRLDYFVLSEKLKPHLADNMVRDKVLGSDHCPIALCLNL